MGQISYLFFNKSDNGVDIVFVIESLCHSSTKKRVFKEVKRVLKRNGVFIIFDGYTGKKATKLTKDELLAKKLTEKGMSVDNFDYYPDFRKDLTNSELKIIEEEEDVSLLILPTLRKFEKLATKIYQAI